MGSTKRGEMRRTAELCAALARESGFADAFYQWQSANRITREDIDLFQKILDNNREGERL